MNDLRFVIITGLSGAGKTLALRHLEDLGYFCIDNLPPALIAKFTELCRQSSAQINRIAIVMDIRGGTFFDSLTEALAYLKAKDYAYEILFLDADDDILIRRYKEVRRQHPLAGDGSLEQGIKEERARLNSLKSAADSVINTANLTPQQLRHKLEANFADPDWEKTLTVRISSFGFKYGLPLDADLVFDVRFLPNPFYIEHLRPLSGEDAAVRDHILALSMTQGFLARLGSLLDWLLPLYVKEGKGSLVIAIGCTGGRHRSVAIAAQVQKKLAAHYRTLLEHRDIEIEAGRDG